MTEHAPAPWEFDDDDPAEGSEVDIVAADGSHVCTVSNVDTFPCVDEEDAVDVNQVAQANAALIKAAPELLAACEAILAGWGHQDGVSMAVELARVAVAKAKGGA